MDNGVAPDTAVARGPVWRPVWQAIVRLSQPDVRIVSGGIAFYALFAVFPLIYLTLTLLIAILPGELSARIAGSIAQILTSNVEPLASDEVSIISEMTPQGLTFRALIAFIVVAFTATSGAKAVITGIRMIAGDGARSSLFGFQGVSLALTGALILLVWALGAAQLIATIVQESDLGSAGRFAGQVAALASTLWITKWVASFALFYLMIALSLRGRISAHWPILAGAATGAAVWLVLTWGFQIYLRVSVLDTLYGALAGLILGFIWLELSVMTLLLGAALAVEWARWDAAGQPRTESA